LVPVSARLHLKGPTSLSSMFISSYLPCPGKGAVKCAGNSVGICVDPRIWLLFVAMDSAQ